MSYGHEWRQVEGHEGIFICQACNMEEDSKKSRADFFDAPCPERIVQEVVRRIGVELQKANIMPAKRRHQPR